MPRLFISSFQPIGGVLFSSEWRKVPYFRSKCAADGNYAQAASEALLPATPKRVEHRRPIDHNDLCPHPLE
jgi:hypothetical protein